MSAFVDEAVIEVYSGNGGSGAVSFRREKYVPKGGPDGGDGGKGGDVVFFVKKNLKTLSHIKHKRIFKAGNGESGTKKRKHGKDGNDIQISVAPGTLLKDFYNGDIIKDFEQDKEVWIFLKGGKGGKGNWHFRTSTNQAPRYAQKGESGKHRKIVIELNLIADIGFVGLPNAGKSTLLSVLTKARPKIASYPFTTKIPNLGVMCYCDRDIVIADIPGIIKGAASGAGLGIQFLKHISRSFMLLFLVDLSENDCLNVYSLLMNELATYSEELTAKKKMIIGTKMDIDNTSDRLAELKSLYSSVPVFGISAVTGFGIEELKKNILRFMDE